MNTNTPQIDAKQLLPKEHISLEEPPQQKDACIRYLLSSLSSVNRVKSWERSLEALYATEKQMTTAVGNRIAVPHAETSEVSEPWIGFTRSTPGIDFDADDGQPAHLIFLVLAPEGHNTGCSDIINLLSNLTARETLRRRLQSAETSAEVQDVIGELFGSKYSP